MRCTILNINLNTQSGNQEEIMDGWICGACQSLIDNDGSCPCTEQVSLSNWGILAQTVAPDFKRLCKSIANQG
jgi:hypothetical protein